MGNAFNPLRYPLEMYELLDAIAGGLQVDIPHDTAGQAHAARTKFYSFLRGVIHEAGEIRLKRSRLPEEWKTRITGLELAALSATTLIVNGTVLRVLPRSQTETAQRIRTALLTAKPAESVPVDFEVKQLDVPDWMRALAKREEG